MKIKMNLKIKLVHFLFPLLLLISLTSLLIPTAHGYLNRSVGQSPSKNPQVSFFNPVRIVDNSQERQEIELVLNDRGYGLTTDRWFWRLNPSGHTIGDNTEIVADNTIGLIGTVRLAWSGHNYAYIYSGSANDGNHIYFGFIDTHGNIIKNTQLFDSDTSGIPFNRDPSIVWTGTNYAVIWNLGFALLDSDGEVIFIDRSLYTNASYSIKPVIVWTGSEFAIFYTSNQTGDYHFMRLDENGNRLQADKVILSGNNLFESLAWTGSEYGLLWQVPFGDNGPIIFQRLDQAGNFIGDQKVLANDKIGNYKTTLIWTGSKYAAVWDNKFVELDSQGNKLYEPKVFVNSTSWNLGPIIVWNGNSYGLAYGGSDLLGGLPSSVNFVKVKSTF